MPWARRLRRLGRNRSRHRVRDFRAIEVGKTRLRIAADGRSAIVQVQTDPPTAVRDRLWEDEIARVDRRRSQHGRHRDLPPHRPLERPDAEHDLPLPTHRDRRPGEGLPNPAADHLHHDAEQAAAPGGDIASARRSSPSVRSGATPTGRANAVDGNLSTEWASAGDGDRAFITIDLGRKRNITGVSFRTREMSNGSAITRTFAVVVDGGKRYGPFPAGNRLNPRTAAVTFTGRRLRFDVVTSTGGNTGAAEIQVFSRRRQ